MVDTARNVALQEAANADTVKSMATIRQVISDLGLQYFIEHPDPFPESIYHPVNPEMADLIRIYQLLITDVDTRAESYAALPAPAALTAIGVVNAITFARQIKNDQPENEAHIPYLLNIAAAWRQIETALAHPAETEQQLPNP